MNMLQTQQTILQLLTQSEVALQDLLADNHDINTDIHAAYKHRNMQENHKKTIKYISLARRNTILSNEKQKVANMEMVIAVVGTMKAGKSTLINAMVGQEILPNCELPMTAMPTLVTHKKGQTTPILSFKQIQPLMQLRKKIIARLKTENTTTTQQPSFIHSQKGKHLIAQLQDPSLSAIATRYEGQAAIFNILQHVNDLMRMAKALEMIPPYHEYQQINQLPRIEVEFFHLKDNKHFQQARLSFLDTPGPNERGQSDILNTVFQQQLEQASAILLAIDYTQMTSEADAAMRQEVKKIQQRLGQKLIIFVNKFDNASKNTMNSEATRTYVAEQLMHNTLPKKHIFPVSSWWGYLANKALMTLEKTNTLNPNDDWVKDFGEAALGRCWQKKITNLREVKEASHALWRDSQFSAPINNIITNIHTQSAIECLGTSLNKLDTLLNTLNNDINDHLVTLKTDTIATQKNINFINKESDQLKAIKNQINEKKSLVIHEANKKIVNKNNRHIKRAIKITSNFIETGYKENQLIAEINKKERTSSIYAEIERSGNSSILYKNKDHAIYLLNDMQCYINSIKRILLEKSDNILKTNIKDVEKKINAIFDNEFKESFNKVIKNNPMSAYGTFILPKFICKKHIESLQIKNLIAIGVEEKKIMQHKSYIDNKALNKLNTSWGKKIYQKEIKQFEVNIKKIKKYIQVDMYEYTSSIEGYHKKYLEENIIRKIKKDTDEVKNHINDQQRELSITLKKLTQNNEKNRHMITILEKTSKRLMPLVQGTKSQLASIKQKGKPTKKTSASSKKNKVLAPA
jgi:hypothetical protein